MIAAVNMHAAFRRRGKDRCMQWFSTLSHYKDSKVRAWAIFHTENSAEDLSDNDMGNMITQLLNHLCLLQCFSSNYWDNSHFSHTSTPHHYTELNG